MHRKYLKEEHFEKQHTEFSIIGWKLAQDFVRSTTQQIKINFLL